VRAATRLNGPPKSGRRRLPSQPRLSAGRDLGVGNGCSPRQVRVFPHSVYVGWPVGRRLDELLIEAAPETGIDQRSTMLWLPGRRDCGRLARGVREVRVC
jgi:hypothetical protein